MNKQTIIYNDVPEYIFEYHYFKNELVARFLYTAKEGKRVAFQDLPSDITTKIIGLEMNSASRASVSTDATDILKGFLDSRIDMVSEPFVNPAKLGAKYKLVNIQHVFGEWQYAILDKELQKEELEENNKSFIPIYIMRLDAFGGGLIKPNWTPEEFAYQVDFLNKTIVEKDKLYFISINKDLYFHAYRPDDRIFFYHASSDQKMDCLILDNGQILNIEELPMLKARAVQKDVVKYAKLIDENFLIAEPK